MKKVSILCRTAIFLAFMILVIPMGCKDKNEDDSPQNIKIYNGVTDQDLAVRIQTGDINGELYLLSYDLTVIYADGQLYEQEELEEYSSEGLTKINEGLFNYNMGDADSFLTGTFTAAMDSLQGTYSYRFSNIGKTASGQYWALKE